jgi:hypothetical protein
MSESARAARLKRRLQDQVKNRQSATQESSDTDSGTSRQSGRLKTPTEKAAALAEAKKPTPGGPKPKKPKKDGKAAVKPSTSTAQIDRDTDDDEDIEDMTITIAALPGMLGKVSCSQQVMLSPSRTPFL